MHICRGLFISALIVSLACEAERLPDAQSLEADPIDRNASAEDLYFEFVRLRSLDLVTSERMDVLNVTLDRLEADPDAADRARVTREAIASILRRTLGELKKTDPELADAMEAREYARRLNRQGFAISQDLSEVTLVVAGCLGVPTSKGELALVVLLPAGGYLVGKIARIAFKRAVFLLRRARSLEDALIASERVGLELKVARDSPELAGIMSDRSVDGRLLARLKAGFERQGAGGLGKLRPIGPGTLESGGGLVYGPDAVFGNRVRHVLAHTAPDVSKRVHSVFSVERNRVLELVDEAWRMRGAPLPDDPGAFIVPMGRTVGTAGETAVKIIVERGTNWIVTAYPVVP